MVLNDKRSFGLIKMHKTLFEKCFEQKLAIYLDSSSNLRIGYLFPEFLKKKIFFMIFDALLDKNAKNSICDMIAILNRVNLI